MAILTDSELYDLFETGDKPTQQHFRNLIDSKRNVGDKLFWADLDTTLQDVIDNVVNNNIYNNDGVLVGDRVVDGDSFNLLFDNLNAATINAVNAKINVSESFGVFNELDDLFVVDYLGTVQSKGKDFANLKLYQDQYGETSIKTLGSSPTGIERLYIAAMSDVVSFLIKESRFKVTKNNAAWLDVDVENFKTAIGDIDGSNNNTRVVVDDANSIIYAITNNGIAIKRQVGGAYAYIKATNITGSRNIELPDMAGTLALLSDVSAKVTANAAIAGATKTKVTYDAKGLITGGADATTADIAEHASNKYFTDARSIASLLAGFVSGAGTITAADSIIGAIQKLNGNLAVKIKDVGEQVYAGSISFTVSGSAPSGTTGHYYQWSQQGRLVTMSLYLKWATAGSGMTMLLMDLPNDMPVPANITSAGATNNTLYYNGVAHSFNTGTGVGNTCWAFIVRGDGTNRAQRIQVNHASQGNTNYQLIIRYFTDN